MQKKSGYKGTKLDRKEVIRRSKAKVEETKVIKEDIPSFMEIKGEAIWMNIRVKPNSKTDAITGNIYIYILQ